MPKKKTGGANTGASLSGTKAIDDMNHADMDVLFESSAAMLSTDDTVMVDLPESNYTIQPVSAEELHANQSMMKKNPWSTFYRGRLTGMDELVSTATVREISKGLLKKDKISKSQFTNIDKFLNALSAVRLPTNGSGYSIKSSGETMQHPTRKTTAAWASSWKNHGTADVTRRREVLKTFETHAKKGSSLDTTLKAMLVRAITLTLNTFTAPLTAKNLSRLGKVTDTDALNQAEDREREKERVKYLGGKQRSGGDNSIDRDWEKDDRSDISEDRFLGDEREKKVRVNKKAVAPTLAPAAPTVNVKKGKGQKTIKAPLATLKTVNAKPKKQTGGVNKLAPMSGAQKKIKKMNTPSKPTGTRKSPRLASKYS